MVYHVHVDVEPLRTKYKALAPVLNERARRIWAATEARQAGRGGITLVARATGISYSTVVRGLKDLESEEVAPPDRVRRAGGGRKKTLQKDPTLVNDLENLVEPAVSGDPQSPLRWTSRSVRTLSEALRGMGHVASHQLVAELLCAAGYSLQSNRKGREGTQPSRSGRAVSLHQSAGSSFPSQGAAGDLRRHEEEGAGRETSKTLGNSGGRRRAPTLFGFTTSSFPRKERRSPTESTT